ncbi:Coatomer/calthrin adaptor appendage, C-terminal subdomain-containing protein [Endogone sp. FLAS-F59071]|nr:Coatomer/calthrin adaptor appendage, C-terminal subdomain-containing protein [Endogone sp. FLAS-F59071]|eukprot:RUS23127.1 Coatomer/calthrin adaptor appendage, C-terminal subdomain-containing protein [Endogone sp. FLAS-F59071]
MQFNCTNTLNDQLLEEVTIVMQPEVDDIGLVEVVNIPAPKLQYNNPGVSYVAFKKDDPDDFPLDCDPTSGEPDEEGFEDEYQVEDVELLTGDYILPTYIGNFVEAWEQLGDENEVVETFALDKDRAPSLKAACNSIIELLSMHAVEDTATPKSNTVHTLLVSGTFLGGGCVLARSRMTFSPTTGVAFELAVRSENRNVSQVVVGAIA